MTGPIADLELDTRTGIQPFATGLRVGLLTLAASALLAVPVAAQVESVEEAQGLEGIGVLEAFVYFLMAVVPIIALIIVLGSFVGLMSTTNAQKKTEIKNIRNQAILYGLILAPALGTIISLLAAITGNPVIDSMDI